MRFNITTKFILFASLLGAIPFIGRLYIDDMATQLNQGQQINLMNNAKAVATALNGRENLFNKYASFQNYLVKGKDFFPKEIDSTIQMDGLDTEWQKIRTNKNTHYYDFEDQITNGPKLLVDEVTVSYKTYIARNQDYLYLFFTVVDDEVVFRGKNKRSFIENDHINFSTLSDDNKLQRYVFSTYGDGWDNPYKFPTDKDARQTAEPEKRIGSRWRLTEQGYNVEIRIPNELVNDKIGFSIVDIDSRSNQRIPVVIGSANTRNIDTLGTLTVPSPEIEIIINAMARTNTDIRIVDRFDRVLNKREQIQEIDNASPINLNDNNTGWRDNLRLALSNIIYRYFLSTPSKDFQLKKFEHRVEQKQHIKNVLSTGKEQLHSWTTTDGKAKMISAAYPIMSDGKVQGVVVIEENDHAIRTQINQLLEGMIIAGLLLTLSIVGLVFYAFRVSARIRKLSGQVDKLTDGKGRIKGRLASSKVNDEIGALSRSFTDIFTQLGQYNDYLQNMSSRLSHELKTPVAVVKSSLEHLAQSPNDKQNTVYIERAQIGINRLNSMLMAMSEATNLEQSLQSTDHEIFDLAKVVEGCSNSYKQIFAEQSFDVNIVRQPIMIDGSDEHIAQLFDKVINNAVEFSGNEQPISITLDSDKNNAVLAISNSGPLLPDDMSDNIFEAMISVRPEAQKQQPHLGIGLYISRLIAKHHNGTIQASNLTDKSGVMITLTLPLAS